jgi:hypothetical protein
MKGLLGFKRNIQRNWVKSRFGVKITLAKAKSYFSLAIAKGSFSIPSPHSFFRKARNTKSFYQEMGIKMMWSLSIGTRSISFY